MYVCVFVYILCINKKTSNFTEFQSRINVTGPINTTISLDRNVKLQINLF